MFGTFHREKLFVKVVRPQSNTSDQSYRLLVRDRNRRWCEYAVAGQGVSLLRYQPPVQLCIAHLIGNVVGELELGDNVVSVNRQLSLV